MDWLIGIGIFLLLLAGVLLLRVRLRLLFEDDNRLVGISLGRRNGFDVDLICRRGTFRLLGLPLYRVDLMKKEESVERETEPGPPMEEEPRRSKLATLRAVRDVFPETARALWHYGRGLYRATRIEDFRARIEAGFEDPSQTGITYGYYQAALGGFPAIISRIRFEPQWTGEAFHATGRLVLAIPLYRLLWLTLVLIRRLPKKRILAITRRQEKGADHV